MEGYSDTPSYQQGLLSSRLLGGREKQEES